MRERPILFSGPIVRAILSGTKTQTRRTKALEYFARLENDPDGWWCARVADGVAYMVYKHSPHERAVRCPYGQPGDRLWVRETFADIGCRLTYRADTNDGAHCMVKRWTPSIHMPRSDCRLVLEITDVRIERLQAISEADCCAEGIPGHGLMFYDGRPATAKDAFESLWTEINGANAWAANPWVWVVEFRAPAHG